MLFAKADGSQSLLSFLSPGYWYPRLDWSVHLDKKRNPVHVLGTGSEAIMNTRVFISFISVTLKSYLTTSALSQLDLVGVKGFHSLFSQTLTQKREGNKDLEKIIHERHQKNP